MSKALTENQLEIAKNLGDVDALVENWRKLDPKGYANMDDRKARIAAVLQENFVASARKNPHLFSLNDKCRELFNARGVRRMDETTTDSDVADIVAQLLPIISRAVSENPVFNLVNVLPMTAPSANIVYFDVSYGSSGGAYSSGSRVDLNDDPTYSDRTDCTAAARELNMALNRETTTAADKVLGGQICITAEQDAQAQYNISLRERLAMWILKLLEREWARLVTDDLRTMAGNTTSWSATVPAPYSSLNTNEWRKVLVETLITLDAAIREDVYEHSTWLLTTPTSGAIIERIQRPDAPSPVLPGPGSVTLAADQENTRVAGRWAYYQDPFFADNTFLIGVRDPKLVDTAPYYFMPYQMADNVSMLFHPLTQVLEMGAISRASRKMIEPNYFGRLDVTA